MESFAQGFSTTIVDPANSTECMDSSADVVYYSNLYSYHLAVQRPVRICSIADKPWTVACEADRVRLHYLSTSPHLTEYIADMCLEWKRIVGNLQVPYAKKSFANNIGNIKIRLNPRFTTLIRPNVAVNEMRLWYSEPEWLPYRKTVVSRPVSAENAENAESYESHETCMLYINCNINSPWYTYILVFRNGTRKLHTFGTSAK